MRVTRGIVVLAAALALAAASSHAAIVGVESLTRDLYEIDPTTGVCTLLRTTTLPEEAFGACGAGGLIYLYVTPDSDPGSLYVVNAATGGWSVVGQYSGDATNINGLAYDSGGGVLYGTDYSSLYIVDLADASTTLVGAFGAGVDGMWAMGYVPGAGLYGVDQDTHRLYLIDVTTGAATEIGATPDRIIDIAYDPDTGRLLGSSNVPTAIYEIDMTTGAGTLLNSTGVPSMLGIAYVAQTVIPEPTTLTMLGLCALGLWRRRRKAR